MIKLSDYVMNFIAHQGVEDIFMLSGGGCMHLVDSVGRNKEITYTCCLFEQAAAFAAAAHAQYTGNIGVALVTTGPGGTNALTGVAAAWTDSIPLLIISGQVKRADISASSGVRMLGYQEVDIVSMAKPVTKYAHTVLEPGKIKYHLEKAVFLARSGRPGPVWIDIPLDVQAALIDEQDLASFNTAEMDSDVTLGRDKAVADKIEAIYTRLKRSHRPVIIAGYGICASQCRAKFLELVQTLRVPVLTTWKALDLMPENHTLYFGRPGCIGQRGANFIQQNADLVIAIGARLDFGQIGYEHELFARAADKIIVDIDAAELAKFKFPVKAAVNTGADRFVDAFLNRLENDQWVDPDGWLERCAAWKRNYPVVLREHWKAKEFTSTYALVDTLSRQSKPTDLFVPENSGAASEVVMQALRLQKGQRVISTNSLGAMGSGLPASIGACIASKKNNTICVIGDGGFMLNIQDLETVSRLGLPIKYFFLNNDGYGSIRNMQNNYFDGLYVASESSSGVTIPDIEKVSHSYKIKFMRVGTNSDLEKIVSDALGHPGPVICEIRVEPNEKTMPKLTSMVKPDGTMVSMPLEDLWPFLDREEFLANMIVDPVEASR